MAADYDRLFQPPEGIEIPEEALAHTSFDVNAPSPAPPPPPVPPMPTSPPQPNGKTPPPMPVDWTPAPPRAESPTPPMPVDLPRRPPPARAEPPATAKPNGQVPPPMPVDLPKQSPPAAPVEQTQAPAPQQGRHARRGHRDPVDDGRAAVTQTGQRANSHRANGRRAGSQPAPATAPGRPSIPARPRTGPTAPPPKPVAAQPVPVRTAGQAAPSAAQPSRPPATIDRRDNLALSDLSVGAAPKKRAARLVPQRGWRRGVYALTRINFGLSRDEKYEIDLRSRIGRTIRGSYEIAVVGLKGGAGKTTVTAALGSVFAQVRGDRILALDADQAAGNLADRVGRQSAATIADLLANDALAHYNDIRAHTSSNAVNLEVLSAAEYTAPRTMSEADWRRTVAVVPRYYNLVLADCGVDLFDPATRGVLATASGLVIVSSASIDAVRQASIAIDWLRHSEFQTLLERACVVINQVVPTESDRDTDEWARRFEQYVGPGRVIRLPWDKHIAAGTEIQLDLLGENYTRRITELAAALSDDFDRGESR
jgi:MinD-like ATPase involved in chromosome partitioning or flagellar assembly